MCRLLFIPATERCNGLVGFRLYTQKNVKKKEKTDFFFPLAINHVTPKTSRTPRGTVTLNNCFAVQQCLCYITGADAGKVIALQPVIRLLSAHILHIVRVVG